MICFPFIQGLEWSLAYESNGRTIQRPRKKTGVYLIRENGRIVYVGMSKSCLYKACYRHFYHWKEHPKFHRVTYRNSLHQHPYYVAFIEISVFQVIALEALLIRLLQPRDNRFYLKEENIQLFYECPNCKTDSLEKSESLLDSCYTCGYQVNQATGLEEINRENILPF